MSRPPAYRRPGLRWLAQACSGLLLLVLLCVHMIANHFVVSGGLQTYADVVAYLSNPVILILELTLLFAVTGHAALGVRAVLFDLGLSRQAGRNVNVVLGVLSVVAIAYGAWLTSKVIGGWA